MAAYAALLRGVNVGIANRIAMKTLSQLFAEVGYSRVRTLLNSGNVVFEASSRPKPAHLESAIRNGTDVACGVIVLDPAQLGAVIEANPFAQLADNPSKLFITILAAGVAPATITTPEESRLGAEHIAVAPNAVYQWCPDGISRSMVPAAFWRQFSGTLTTRNAATLDKILTLLG